MNTSRPAPHRLARTLLLLVCAISAAAPSGCNSLERADAQAGNSARDTSTRTNDSMTDDAKPTPNPVPDAVMRRLIDEAAADSGMHRDAIVLVRAERATWPDTSRGCPQPNMGYAQVIVQGYWVLLRAGRQEYDFRVGPDLDHIRCTGATRQAPIVYPDN